MSSQKKTAASKKGGKQINKGLLLLYDCCDMIRLPYKCFI
uniref:Uncharacterized protein n=1 Tax=Heterorhabditis bacteriophora TaxID=37862 RepID=A0A1I7W7Z6_HETBA